MNRVIRFGKRALYPGFDLASRSRTRIARFFVREPNIRTLDIGCGNGYFSARAARASKDSVVLGITFDPEQVSRCNEFKPSMRVDETRVTFRVMNASELDKLDVQFDQILLLELIEHIDDDLKVMKNIGRLLAPHGVLHLTTPDIQYGTWCGMLDRHATGGHCRLGYTAERVQNLIAAAGLDLAYLGKYGGLGNFLVAPQNAITNLFGGSVLAHTLAFLAVYPFYVLLNLIPVPSSLRMYYHAIGRQRGLSRGTHSQPESLLHDRFPNELKTNIHPT